MSYFSTVDKINYEGVTTENPMAFRHYNPSEVVMGKNHEGAFTFRCRILAHNDAGRFRSLRKPYEHPHLGRFHSNGNRKKPCRSFL